MSTTKPMPAVIFHFHPGQSVRITAYGLNCSGTVQRCMWLPRNGMSYEVEYALSSEIKLREFYNDQLEAT